MHSDNQNCSLKKTKSTVHPAYLIEKIVHHDISWLHIKK